MDVYFQGINASFIHSVASPVLSVPGDEAPRLGFVRIIDIIELLTLLPRVVGSIGIIALVIALARFLFHD